VLRADVRVPPLDVAPAHDLPLAHHGLERFGHGISSGIAHYAPKTGAIVIKRPLIEGAGSMPKPNYAFAKRQRELAKKQKKEAKQKERDAAKAPPPDATPSEDQQSGV
jgi:hypothetical protein